MTCVKRCWERTTQLQIADKMRIFETLTIKKLTYISNFVKESIEKNAVLKNRGYRGKMDNYSSIFDQELPQQQNNFKWSRSLKIEKTSRPLKRCARIDINLSFCSSSGSEPYPRCTTKNIISVIKSQT